MTHYLAGIFEKHVPVTALSCPDPAPPPCLEFFTFTLALSLTTSPHESWRACTKVGSHRVVAQGIDVTGVTPDHALIDICISKEEAHIAGSNQRLIAFLLLHSVSGPQQGLAYSQLAQN